MLKQFCFFAVFVLMKKMVSPMIVTQIGHGLPITLSLFCPGFHKTRLPVLGRLGLGIPGLNLQELDLPRSGLSETLCFWNSVFTDSDFLDSDFPDKAF